MKRVWSWFLRASLWIASAGLMLASSGLDGAYLARLMPDGWAWLGLVLNAVADVTSELGMYWYGRLQQDIKAKRQRSRWILLGQAVLVGYAWLFGWRQLVPRMRIVDPEGARWMAPLAAAFIPAALVVAGFILSLLAGKPEKEQDTSEPKAERKPAQPKMHPFACQTCGQAFGSQNALNGHQRKHSNGQRAEPERERTVSQ